MPYVSTQSFQHHHFILHNMASNIAAQGELFIPAGLLKLSLVLHNLLFLASRSLSC